jgi:hypothetical protein
MPVSSIRSPPLPSAAGIMRETPDIDQLKRASIEQPFHPAQRTFSGRTRSARIGSNVHANEPSAKPAENYLLDWSVPERRATWKQSANLIASESPTTRDVGDDREAKRDLQSDRLASKHAVQTYRGTKHSGVAAMFCRQLQT